MRRVSWLLPTTGVLLLLSAVSHALFGWPSIRDKLLHGGAEPDLVGAIAIGWYFGSVAMAVFGIAILLSWRERIRGKPMGRDVVILVSVTYLAFGTYAFVARSFNSHFLLAFLVPGFLLALPAAFCRWRR